jgi:transposase
MMIDGRSFLAYIEQVLAPTLRAGEIVVLDNVSTHKVVGVREAIEAKGAKVLYLPPYSPDFNPIEKSFSKIKSVLQRIAARTVNALDAAVARPCEASRRANARITSRHPAMMQLDRIPL